MLALEPSEILEPILDFASGGTEAQRGTGWGLRWGHVMSERLKAWPLDSVSREPSTAKQSHNTRNT